MPLSLPESESVSRLLDCLMTGSLLLSARLGDGLLAELLRFGVEGALDLGESFADFRPNALANADCFEGDFVLVGSVR